MSRHFLVIGGQRCGTTYLHALLDAHPGIAMARPARPEPKVFCSEELSARGHAWYDATFFADAAPDQVLGEKSTSYLEDPDAPERAARVLDDPTIVAQLRDPVERAVSNWAFSTDNGLETRPLETALQDNLAGGRDWDRDATSVSPYAYLERGRYAEHLRRWTDRFAGRVHVLFLRELLDDDRTLAALYDALGVDSGFRPPVREPVNTSTEPVPTLSQELLHRLRDYYAGPDAELSTMLGRELPWRGSHEQEEER